KSNPGYMGSYTVVPIYINPLWPDDAAGVASLYPVNGQNFLAPVTIPNCQSPQTPTTTTLHKTSLINVSGRVEGAVRRVTGGGTIAP
ncbi:hypothetical protein Q8G40_28885, partial [Klebsiella pneumoniae]|uniref:hypothetical protein n=1 Tax=Klebsiella pneumoniae TaxID=573 RepID=UPI003013E094